MPQHATPGEVLTRHHRRCASALADFHLLVIEEDTTLTHAEAVLGVDRLVRRVLDELHAAETTVLDVLAGSDRRKPAARLLGGRLDRLRRAAIQVGAAARAGDVPSLRRSLTRFDALARAACAVQLDVYGSAVVARRPARRPEPRDAAAQAVHQGTHVGRSRPAVFADGSARPSRPAPRLVR